MPPVHLKIAVIGAGASGLSCAWMLTRHHAVTVYEKDDRIGGFANTHAICDDMVQQRVEIGFCDYHPPSSPILNALHDHLRIERVNTQRGCSILTSGGAVLSADVDPRDKLWESMHAVLQGNPASVTVGEWLQRTTADRVSRRHLAAKLMALIPVSTETIANWPLSLAARWLREAAADGPFLRVQGGSERYIQRLGESVADLRLNSGVRRVRRHSLGGRTKVVVTDWQGQEQCYDHVVLACHADQALGLLRDPCAAERESLNAVRFQRVRAVLHRDQSVLPVGASDLGVSYIDFNEEGAPPCVTHQLNLSHGFSGLKPLFLTLNPSQNLHSDQIEAAFFHHYPLIDQSAAQAQQRQWLQQGYLNTWYCGAWLGDGSHEHAVQSGMRVGMALGGCASPLDVAEAAWHFPSLGSPSSQSADQRVG